ncbi:MAG: DUF58 domain-containing protein [Chloroflexota bacterium]|nr:DUF58 domain-containing protein [Chloroflexota bacterium]
MLRHLIQPWVLYRFCDGDAEVTLVWRNRLSLFVLLLLLLVELFSPSRVTMVLLLTFASVTAVAAWWAWHMARGVRVRRVLRFPWVQVGDLLEERFTLANDSPLPVLWVEVSDRSDVPGYNASTVRSVGARGAYRWSTSGECRLRGEYHLGPWEATTCDPFGFFTVVQRNPSVQTVLVYPPIARRLPFALPRGAATGRARTNRRSWGPTISVGGVRDYVPGDPFHHVHWPTTARRGALYAKVFDQETGGDIWLVLDLNRDVQVGQGERSTEEMGVIVAASVAALLLDAGRAVGLIAYGPQRHTVMPARGRGHLWGLLRVLAQVQVADSRPLGRVLEEVARALPTGATSLVITPSYDPAWVSGLARLQNRGVGAAALLLDAPSFEEGRVEGHLSSQAQALRGLLAQVGVEAEVIHADTPLSLRPPTGQVRRWEFKVLGTGRAVAISTPWGFSSPGGGWGMPG